MKKQKIDKSEPYFIHVGYTFTHESLKYYMPYKGKGRRTRVVKLKVRSSKQRYLAKLNKYWKLSLL